MLVLGRHIKGAGVAGVFAVCAIFAPSPVSALSFVQAVGFFHVVFGLLLAFTLLMFGMGLVVYFARLNTWPSHRETAIDILRWAVVMLFVLVLLVALVNFFQNHQEIALPILAFVIFVIAVIVILRLAFESKKPPEAEERRDDH